MKIIVAALGAAAATFVVSACGSTTSTIQHLASCRAACQSPDAGTEDAAAPTDAPIDTTVPAVAEPGASVLVYTIHSDADSLVVVSYLNNSGHTEHTHAASGSWTKTITPNDVQVPVLTATGDGSGTFVSCSILRDGVLMEHNRANGPSAMVSCEPTGSTAHTAKGRAGQQQVG